jgi:choline dehydrogenase
VNHYSDLSQAVRDPKYMYQLPNGSYYTGLSPPVGAVPKGTFYPRSAAVGGCVSHNALIMYYPLANDFDVIANLTNDESWLAVNMRKYWERLEDNQYVANGTPGHGFSGWLQTNRVEESVFFTDSKVYPMLKVANNTTSSNAFRR